MYVRARGFPFPILISMELHLAEGVGLFGGALCFARWIAQREDDGAFVQPCHLSNKAFTESSGRCRGACTRTQGNMVNVEKQ